VLYYWSYRCYQRILENSWIFIKKNRDLWNTKHFQNSIVYYLLFDFLGFLTSFFVFYISTFVKKFLKIMCFFIVWFRDFIKALCKTMAFFFKIFEVFEIQNFTKISSFTISFYIFSIFHIFFFLFHLSKLIQKLLNFVYYFIGRIRDMWNNFFPNSAKYYLFFYYVQHFLFYFIYLYLSKNSENFYVLLFYGLEILLKDFRKSRNIFLQNYRHLKSKILHKFHRSLFFLYFFYHFWHLLSLFHLSELIKKFKTFLWYFIIRVVDFIRELWKILEFLLRKIEIFGIQNIFQNSIIYYLLFNFLVFLTSFFLVYVATVVKKFFKFMCCFIVWIRYFTKEFCKTIVLFSKNLRHLKSKSLLFTISF